MNLLSGDEMNVGDLVEYVPSCEPHPDQQRALGTIIRDDHAENDNYCYIVWHTADNQGWWDKRCLKVAVEVISEGR